MPVNTTNLDNFLDFFLLNRIYYFDKVAIEVIYKHKQKSIILFANETESDNKAIAAFT